MNEMTIRKTPRDWTPEQIERFWDWHGTNAHAESNYFSNQVGLGIVNFLSMTGNLQGRVLDYGCGVGHLLSHLLQRGLHCYGVDSSQRSISRVNEKFSGIPNWMEGKVVDGFVTSYPDEYFDVITCIETLEHLPEEAIFPMLKELKRILRPNGILLITTPYSENLDQNLFYCPFCDSEYHKWQHMRSLSIEYMQSLLCTHEFRILFCQNMDFQAFNAFEDASLPPITLLSLRRIKSWVNFKHRRLLDRLFPRPFPRGKEIGYRLSLGKRTHLCALVTK